MLFLRARRRAQPLDCASSNRQAWQGIDASVPDHVRPERYRHRARQEGGPAGTPTKATSTPAADMQQQKTPASTPAPDHAVAPPATLVKPPAPAPAAGDAIASVRKRRRTLHGDRQELAGGKLAAAQSLAKEDRPAEQHMSDRELKQSCFLASIQCQRMPEDEAMAMIMHSFETDAESSIPPTPPSNTTQHNTTQPKPN